MNIKFALSEYLELSQQQHEVHECEWLKGSRMELLKYMRGVFCYFVQCKMLILR